MHKSFEFQRKFWGQKNNRVNRNKINLCEIEKESRQLSGNDEKNTVSINFLSLHFSSKMYRFE